MENYISTIIQKIETLKTAILYSTSNDVLKLPTHIVHTLKVDDNGKIWFIVPRPHQSINAFEKTFPVELHYFKKGNPDIVKVNGRAEIITDETIIGNIDFISEERKAELLPQHIFLCVKMMQVEVEEVDVEEKKTFWKSLKHSILHFVSPQAYHQTFDLSI